MSEGVRLLLERIIQTEENLNSLYTELSEVDQTQLKARYQEFQNQGWNRISELHAIRKSMPALKS